MSSRASKTLNELTNSWLPPQGFRGCACRACQTSASSGPIQIAQWRSARYAEFPPNNPGTLTDADTLSLFSDSNPFINGLMTGSKWGAGDPDSGTTTEIHYYTFDKENIPSVGYGSEWESAEIAARDAAMQAYAEVGNITFTATADYNDSNISWALLNNSDSFGALGWAYTPENGSSSGLTTVNWEQYYDSVNNQIPAGKLDPGSYYYITFTHELGHSLGLKHPHGTDSPYNPFPGVTSSSDTGDNGLNAGPWTVMTYNDIGSGNNFTATTNSSDGFLMNLGAFDIAAIQYLYGANTSHGSGNNIYNLDESSLNGFFCIWDNGGTDTISGASSSTQVNIDLRGATLDNAQGGGGYASQVGSLFKGYTIAYNSTGSCIIENAIGSAYNDTIRGNVANNRLNGGGGSDSAVFTGDLSDYSFSLNGSSELVVQDQTSNRDGTDTLVNIESITFFDQSVTYSQALALVDNTSPTITITTNDSSLTVGETATLTFTLSESSTNFISSDVSVSGGVISGFSGSGTTYTATFTPTTNSTANGIVAVASGAFTDSAGNANADGSDANNTVTMSVNTVSGDGGGGGGGGGVSSSSPTAATTPTSPSPVTPISQPATPTPTASTATTPTAPSPESPILDIQPQATVNTVQLPTPLTLGNMQITQAVVGTSERDVITGSDEGEALAGGQGKDQMTGGGGPDAFIFETPGEFGRKNADVITDFNPNEGDIVTIASEAFDGVSRIRFKSVTGKKEAKRMGQSSKNFIYDEKKGMLYYDENGKKNGWGDGGEFVKLTGAPEIGKTDIVIV